MAATSSPKRISAGLRLPPRDFSFSRVADGAAVPVDILGPQAGRVGLRGAGVPEQFVEVAALVVIALIAVPRSFVPSCRGGFGLDDSAMFFEGDRPLRFENRSRAITPRRALQNHGAGRRNKGIVEQRPTAITTSAATSTNCSGTPAQRRRRGLSFRAEDIDWDRRTICVHASQTEISRSRQPQPGANAPASSRGSRRYPEAPASDRPLFPHGAPERPRYRVQANAVEVWRSAA